jgi:hypothetical protein
LPLLPASQANKAGTALFTHSGSTAAPMASTMTAVQPTDNADTGMPSTFSSSTAEGPFKKIEHF